MKKIITTLSLFCMSFYVSAIVVTFEVSDSGTFLSTESSFQQIDTNTPDTYTVEYSIDENDFFNWKYDAGIYSGPQIGTSEVYNTNFQLLERPSVFPQRPVFTDYLANNFEFKDSAQSDFYFVDDYTDVRVDVWEHTLFPPYQNDPAHSRFDDKADAAFSISTNDEIAWGVDENGQQSGQTYEWTSRMDYRELFDENPYQPYASTQDFLDLLFAAMNNGTEFNFLEQLFVADFSRSSGSQDTFIDFNDFNSYAFLQANGSARIVGITGATAVSEPGSLALLLAGALLVFRRKLNT